MFGVVPWRAAAASSGADIMKGPFPMTVAFIQQKVPAEPGTYVLGTASNHALYVSRADNLRVRLQTHFGVRGPNTVDVDQFWFQTAPNEWAAYLVECTWFHQFSPTHNATHPTRPPVSLVGCPICGR
jgi:excinuclease UvrABC nuclease subunit